MVTAIFAHPQTKLEVRSIIAHSDYCALITGVFITKLILYTSINIRDIPVHGDRLSIIDYNTIMDMMTIAWNWNE